MRLGLTRQKTFCDLPGSTTNLRQLELDTPHLALVPQTIFTDELELSIPKNIALTNASRDVSAGNCSALSGPQGNIQTSGLKGATRDLVGLAVSTRSHTCSLDNLWLVVSEIV